MIFNSLDYFIFLVIVLLVYYYVNRRTQNIWLLLASYYFYSCWDWKFLSLIILSTITDYACGKVLGRQDITAAKRKYALSISLVVNLGLLGIFKYFNFFIDSAATLLETVGLQPNLTTLEIILPVGISFYTFQTLSYTIDIYRGKLKPINDPLDFALFVSFFPQLVAGPIERASKLLPQLAKKRQVNSDDIYEGVYLILIGLFRKVVLADTAAIYVNQAFSHPDLFTSSGLLIATLLFSIQIYCDFAGYSDIARGTSRLLGIKLMVNFKQPYFSTSITEFWRRWHISLSTWLRDYLYIPLGGNRHGTFKTYRNLFLTMLLGGLWHGAAWGFVVWGALHGTYLAIHKFIDGGSNKDSLDEPFFTGMSKRIFIILLVSLTWIPFRQPDGIEAWNYFTSIIQWHGSIFDTSNPGKVLEPGLVLLMSISALLIIDLPMYLKDKQTALLDWHWSSKGTVYAALILGVMLLGGKNEVAFIYFQF